MSGPIYSLGSMHRCLCVDEIMRLIAYELVASGGRATSIALACCCKSFEEPVLDALWGARNRLPPLLGSLPRDVWGGHGCMVSAPKTCVFSSLNYLVRKSFKRPPTTLEWARFRKYARRMRMLEEYGNLHILSPKVFSVLQRCAVNEPLLPNLKTLQLGHTTGSFIPFVPLFLSPKLTVIDITTETPNLPKAMVASMVATVAKLCPNLQKIILLPLPRDPTITAAVSEMLLATSQNGLRCFQVDSPLTEKAREVIYRLPGLRVLWATTEGPTSLPTMVLPSLTTIDIGYNHDRDWLQGFRGATLGKLASITFRPKSAPIGDFLGAFESVALTTSTPATLSTFRFYTSHPWRPSYRSLLSFTQLKELVIEFSCERGCSSTIDDDIITDIARAMPRLQVLNLGKRPCQARTGATVKGLTALARYCPHLSRLGIHFQVITLDPPMMTGVASDGEPTILQEQCVLTTLDVGEIPVPEDSRLGVALTLLRIFPHITHILYLNSRGWRRVADAISLSKRLVDRSSKNPSLARPRSKIDGTSPRSRT